MVRPEGFVGLDGGVKAIMTERMDGKIKLPVVRGHGSACKNHLWPNWAVAAQIHEHIREQNHEQWSH